MTTAIAVGFSGSPSCVGAEEGQGSAAPDRPAKTRRKSVGLARRAVHSPARPGAPAQRRFFLRFLSFLRFEPLCRVAELPIGRAGRPPPNRPPSPPSPPIPPR